MKRRLATHFAREVLDLPHRRVEGLPDRDQRMLALGRVCTKTDRTASAITYLERAYEIDPSNFAVRRALAELGRKPKPLPRPSRPELAKPAVAVGAHAPAEIVVELVVERPFLPYRVVHEEGRARRVARPEVLHERRRDGRIGRKHHGERQRRRGL